MLTFQPTDKDKNGTWNLNINLIFNKNRIQC